MIIVTGSSGFIGSALVDHLVTSGIDVVGIDRRPPPSARSRHHHVADLGSPLPHRLGTLLARAAAVVHLAGRPGVRDRSAGIELARHRDNVVATGRVLAASRAPVIVASSSSVYGGSHAGRPCGEGDDLRPLGGYARSKVAAELVAARHRRAGREVCVVRPFTVVGAGQRPGMALDRWLRAALDGRPIDVYGSLERTRDLTDLIAVVHVLAALSRGAAGGGRLPAVLNIGSGRAHSLRDVVDAVARAVTPHRRPVVRVLGAQEAEPDHTLADTTLLAATVGPVPPTDLDRVVQAHLGLLSTDNQRLAVELSAPALQAAAS